MADIASSSKERFEQNYQRHLKHLTLKGLQPKTIDAYSRAIRRIGEHFDFELEQLSDDDLLNYFSGLAASHSFSTVKLDYHGLKFYYRHVLGNKPWGDVPLIKPPQGQRLPDIVTVAEMQRIIASTRILSYRVFFLTVYGLGLRLGEGVRLQVGDIDAVRHRVHVRDAKGNKDRLVPLPDRVLTTLRAFWRLHRHPTWLFPNRARGLSGAAQANSPLDRGGIQRALQRVVEGCGLKKTSHPTVCATAMPPI